MNDLESRIRDELRGREGGAPALDLSDAHQVAGRTRRRQILNVGGAGVGALAVVVALTAAIGGLVRADRTPTPAVTPSPTVPRGNAEVLRFTGDRSSTPDTPGDLVAVDPDTGDLRVLVEDIENVYRARWSADGRWVAYETDAADGGRALWVSEGSKEPRLVAKGGDRAFPSLALFWMWSPNDASLATIARSRLQTIDVASGEKRDLGELGSDIFSGGPTWAWSPDGSRIAFAAPEGSPTPAIQTVDLRSGAHSGLAVLPDTDWYSTEELLWSPDGSHLAVRIGKASNEAGRLYMMEADGSNIRVVADDFDPMGLAWSPDGSQLGFVAGSVIDAPTFETTVRVASTDAEGSTQVAVVDVGGCRWNYECSVAWSPDGSTIAFRNDERDAVIAYPVGGGEPRSLDPVVFASWAGGHDDPP